MDPNNSVIKRLWCTCIYMICLFLIFISWFISDDINNTNTLPRRGKNGDIARRSVSDSDMNGRNTPPGTSVDATNRLLICTP